MLYKIKDKISEETARDTVLFFDDNLNEVKI